MIVALAASTAFMTPVSSPVNTLVVGPGQYGFGDFVKVGVPFAVIVESSACCSFQFFCRSTNRNHVISLDAGSVAKILRAACHVHGRMSVGLSG